MQQKRGKRAMRSLKAYFLIVNLIVAVMAFSWMVRGQTGEVPPELSGWTEEQIEN